MCYHTSYKIVGISDLKYVMSLTVYLNEVRSQDHLFSRRNFFVFREKIETTITQLKYDQITDWYLANSRSNCPKELIKTFVYSKRI